MHTWSYFEWIINYVEKKNELYISKITFLIRDFHDQSSEIRWIRLEFFGNFREKYFIFGTPRILYKNWNGNNRIWKKKCKTQLIIRLALLKAG